MHEPETRSCTRRSSWPWGPIVQQSLVTATRGDKIICGGACQGHGTVFVDSSAQPPVGGPREEGPTPSRHLQVRQIIGTWYTGPNRRPLLT